MKNSQIPNYFLDNVSRINDFGKFKENMDNNESKYPSLSSL